MKKCKYHCDYGDGENCHYTGESGCVHTEQPKKVIRVHKKHIVAVSRYAYSLTGVYQQIVEELIDSGELVIERKINSDILEFIWHLETESEHG